MEGLKLLHAWLVPALVLLALLGVGFLLDRLLERHYARMNGGRQRRQGIMLAVGFCSMLLVIVSLPISDTLRGQILSLIGILLSAAIALSSTTFVGNIMAGMMLSNIGGFRIGDFVRVGDHFGRVSERGLLHVEIQTEDRDLTTLPNLFLVTQPVKVVHAEGTVISAHLSLGYDVPRQQVEQCLLDAAREAGLEEAFVGITELGDYSVGYRVAGKLNEVKKLISTRSRLMALSLDHLHAAGIEIMSPAFHAVRTVAHGHQIIPRAGMPSAPDRPPATGSGPETMLFEKAELAESTERLRERLAELKDELQQAQAALKSCSDENLRAGMEARIAHLERKQERYLALIDAQQDS